MAQFDANINLNVKETNVDKAIRRLEQRLDRLKSKAENIDITPKVKALPQARGFRELKRRIDEVGKSLERFSSIGVGAGIVGLGEALNVAGRAAEQATASFKILGQTVDFSGPINSLGQQLAKATGALDTLTGFMQAIGPAGQAAALGIGVAGAAALAFAPQIRGITEDLGTLTGGLNKFGQDVINAFSAFETGIGSTQGYREAVRRLTDTVDNLSTRQDKAQKALRNVNSQSEAAAAIRQTLVSLTRRLNDEQRAQNVLLEQATRAQREFNQQAQVGTNLARSRAGRADTGFGAFSQAASNVTDQATQTAIDKSIARARAKRIEQASRALPDVGKMPLALPSSEMLNAAERGIKQIRSVTDQLGKDLDYTNQEVANFINGLKNGANEAVKLPKIFDILGSSIKEAVAATEKLKSPMFGPGNAKGEATYKERIRLTNLAGELEQNWTKKLNSLRVRQDAALYRLRQRRINRLAAEQAAADKKAAQRRESLFLGVGFPLLFGGGAGSVTGSALGSIGDSGGGFGGQIIGGAIGQAVDNFVQSIGELGQALNPVTADVGRIVESAGLANTELGKAITELENTAGAAVALREATKELERVVGQDGVAALREFGDRFTTFGNQLAEFFTQVQVAIAKLLRETPLEKNLRTTGETIFQARRSDNAEIQDAVSRLDNASVPNERLAIQKEIVALVEQEAQARQRELELLAISTGEAAAKRREVEASVAEKRIELEIEQLNAAANDETRIALEKKLAFQRLMTEQQALYNQFAREEIKIDVLRLELDKARLEYKKQLAKIDNAAANYKPPKAAGGGIDKEAQVQKTIAGLKTKEFELNTKILNIGLTKLDQIDTELDRLNALRSLKEVEIELSKEDDRIKQLKLTNLEKETSILRQQLELQRERIQLEQQIDEIKARQTTDNLQTSLNQELAGITLPSGNSFLDEQNALKAKQENRYANALQDVNDQLEVQRKLATSTDQAISGAAKERIGQLERTRGIYETMLPQIAAAEQAQLKFNQTLSLVEGPVNAFVNGLTEGLMGVIDGTKSAEEAFADMLKGMGQALIQTAAIMIAQYIAIGVARMFAGLPTMSSGSSIDITQATGIIPIPTGYADGGRPRLGEVSVVGERGPELFVPDQPGRIISNEQSRAALSMYSPGNEAPTATAPNNYSFNTIRIADEEYVSSAQLQEAMSKASADGAKQGEQRAMNRLRQSRATRSKLGM